MPDETPADDLTDESLLRDIELRLDGRGPSKIVYWCGMEFGFVRPLTSNRRHFDAETRRLNKGKWFDPFWPHGFYETAEAAACDLIREKAKRSPESKWVQAALQRDYDLMQSMRKEFLDGVVVEEE